MSIPENQLREIQPLLARLRSALESFRGHSFLKPSVLARKAEVPQTYVVPLLHQLEKEGLGELGVTIIDAHRLPTEFFRTLEDVPHLVRTEMGDELTPSAENIEWVFARAGTVGE